MFLPSLYQQKTIKSYHNFFAKNFKDPVIGMNIKLKMKTKTQQMNIDIFSNQTLLELIYCLFQFI